MHAGGVVGNEEVSNEDLTSLASSLLDDARVPL
jgi:hypothetical protein